MDKDKRDKLWQFLDLGEDNLDQDLSDPGSQEELFILKSIHEAIPQASQIEPNDDLKNNIMSMIADEEINKELQSPKVFNIKLSGILIVFGILFLLTLLLGLMLGSSGGGDPLAVIESIKDLNPYVKYMLFLFPILCILYILNRRSLELKW